MMQTSDTVIDKGRDRLNSSPKSSMKWLWLDNGGYEVNRSIGESLGINR